MRGGAPLWLSPAPTALAVAITVTVGACDSAGGSGGQDCPAEAPPQPFAASHRGDSAQPENTLAAFRAALDAGADVLETDLVLTRDRVLVLRHERRLSLTTDVEEHPSFAERRLTKRVDGHPVADWWVEDFTVAELAALRATRRNTAASADHRIASLADLIDLVREESRARGRCIGLYLETKEPAAFARLGYDLDEAVAEALRASGLDQNDGLVYAQSFGRKSVRDLSARLRVPVVQIISGAAHWEDVVTPAGLRRQHELGVAGINVSADRLGTDPGLVDRAHAAGLAVHGWGFPPGVDYDRWIEAGLDGFVTDDVPAVLAARERGGARG